MSTTQVPLEAPASTCMASSYMFGPNSQPRFLTITDGFLHHASTRPDAIAARHLSSSATGRPAEITYGELSQQSARLARRLRQLGVVPGARVPLVVKRGLDMVVGIMGILACGAQYVPLDGGVVPDSTLRLILEQAGGSACTVLTLRSTRHRVDNCAVGNIVCIDEEDQQQDDLYSRYAPSENLAEPDGGCYVIYTSGKLRFAPFT